MRKDMSNKQAATVATKHVPSRIVASRKDRKPAHVEQDSKLPRP